MNHLQPHQLVYHQNHLNEEKYLYYQNLGNKVIYVGPSGVTTATGLRLSPGSVAEFRLGPNVDLYAISGTAAQDTRWLQFS